MQRYNLNQGWSFQYDTEGNFYNFDPDIENGQQVNVPHDFIIGLDRDPRVIGQSRSGYFPGAAGVYSRYLEVDADWQDKKVILEIDGAYMNAMVMVNSDIVTKHPYGYTAFHADLTRYLQYGRENKLSIYVNNCFLPNSRWYTGGGLYRDVQMLLSPKTYIKPWGVTVQTEAVSADTANVSVTTELVNESAEEVRGTLHMYIERGQEQITEAVLAVRVGAGVEKQFGSSLIVPKPLLWDIDTPELYQVRIEFRNHEEVMDTFCTDFGIRTISVDARDGFRLNGRTLKLKGGCVHHDCGILGAAAYKDYEYRKVKLHKDHGYNAIRCAHNPPSAHFLDACDRYGILVIDEAFDSWRMGKTLNDYSLFFEEWWQRDMTAMIKRDRNHPSVIMWSIGNEIGERSGDSDGYQWAERLSEYARELDPTRPITSGICSIWPTAAQAEEEDTEAEARSRQEINLDPPFSKKNWGPYTEQYAAALDVVGYNYLEHRYEEDGRTYPDRVICGNESFPQSIDRIWELVEKNPHVIGDFTWNSYDYIGEAGLGKALYFGSDEAMPEHAIAHDSPYPWLLAEVSDFDICGFPTPQAAYRRIVWGFDETYIAVHNPEYYGKRELLSLWGWPEVFNHFTFNGYEGRPIKVSVYSRGKEVELFHNGVSLGRKKVTRFRAEFELNYEPGELKAVSYNDEGKLSAAQLKSAGEPVRMRITAEPDNELLKESVLAFLKAEVVDQDDNLVPVDDLKVKAEVSGGAELKAFGNANPKSEENYLNGCFTSYRGQFLAIVAKQRSDSYSGEGGTSILKIHSDQLGDAEQELF